MLPDYIKIDAVRIYKHCRSIPQALEEINMRHGVKVSARSIHLWKKDPRFQTEEDGQLFGSPIMSRGELLKPRFDLKEYVERNKETFPHAYNKLSQLINAIVDSLEVNDIKGLDTMDKIKALEKLEKVRMARANYLIALVVRTEGEGDNLEELLKQVASEFEERPAKAEVVEEHA